MKAPRIGVRGQRQHGDRAVDRRRVTRRIRDRCAFRQKHAGNCLRKRIDAGHIPQQRRRMLKRVVFGEVDAVDAAIDRAVLGDGRRSPNPSPANRHRNCADRAAPDDGARRSFEPPDILRPIAMAARIRRRLGADQPAADIGVERGRRDSEFSGRPRGRRGTSARRFFHIDSYNQD